MSTIPEEHAVLTGKDAASKEREERLENARKKLKKYRARQSKSSMGSSVSSVASSSKRDSSHSTTDRRSSVSNFRESLDLVSGHLPGQSLGGATLQPMLSSFAPAGVEGSPPSPAMSNRSPSPNGWQQTDPNRVLEALKERGRRESDHDVELDPAKTRVAALEALEGRVSAPSEMIDLGNKAEGELMVAPKSPGFVGDDVFPPAGSSPGMANSPMVGLGLGGGKRNSWSAPGPVTAAGMKGATDLGILMEEEEEDGDDESEPGVLASPRRRGGSRAGSRGGSRGGSPKKRPASLFVPPTPDSNAIAVEGPVEETPVHSTFTARPMRLSLSLSSSSSGTPSTAASTMPFATAQSPEASTSTLAPLASAPVMERLSSDEGSHSPASERRRLSLFHSVAVESANGNSALMSRSGSHSPTPPTASKGLRSLSIGTLGKRSPTSPPPRSSTFPNLSRRASSTSTTGPAAPSPSKRSSISYRNTSMSSLGSPEGPLSTASQAARRPWRNSQSGSMSSSMAFPFAPSNGTFGGFGDLEVEETDDEPADEQLQSATTTADDSQVLLLQNAALRTQIEQLRSQNNHLASTSALEIAEFEKKAGEEAMGFRSRIGELERVVEEERIGRRFEVEGLSREVEQAREAITDLTDERDSLREDVEGWRSRCASLQTQVKKEQEDDALAAAQAKLIGEMRDQIYNLVAALERERGEHAETRNEVDRLIAQAQKAQSPIVDDLDEEANVGAAGRGHGFQSASDGSMLSTSSFGRSSFGRSYSGNTTEDTSIMTDMDDSFSSKMSPPSGHSSFGQAIGIPAGSKRDSDLISPIAAVIGGLDTLAEEEEEEDGSAGEAKAGTVSSASTGTSEGMPPTPNKDIPLHARSDSFVRHWSFPKKGSVSSARVSMEDDHVFFDLNRHTSLPALPIADSILPPFLHADLTVDEDHYSAVFEPVHTRRPSSPRPMEKMAPHTRRFSGQYAAKVPPPAPSALAHAAIASASASTQAPAKAGSFSRFSAYLGGWAPGASTAPAPPPVSPLPRMEMSSTFEEEDEEDTQDVFLSSTRHETPASLLHSSRPRLRYVKASQQPMPRASRLALLDFTPICCSNEPVLMV
ncbi:hypothetical protein MNV49_003930 [Pseudohyphozyma bogoriensis]|nr:hypothetical protein MNV49_003930 [Pseudohyphozyma bogoriensis]